MVPVKLLMTPRERLRTIDRDGTIRQSAELMRAHGIGSLLVVKGEDVVGIVTDTDLARRAMACGLDPERTQVERIMSAPLLQIDAEASLLDANDLMAREGVRHLGVQKDGRLLGLVSVRDLVNFLTKYPRS
jgi:CBS domain-containing protein